MRLELSGDALKVLPSLKPGMEIWADGEKVREQYYKVTDISPSDD